MQSFIKNLDIHAQGLWLAIVISLILFIYALLMPKKEISWRDFYITFGIIGFFAWLSDSVFGKMLDIVDFGNPKITGIGEFFSYSLIPSSLAVIYLNYFKRENKWILAIVFTIISTLIEWGMIKVGYMKTHGWGFFVSIPFYFVIFLLILPLHKKIIKCKS
ncbi:hypothetical protein HPT25_06415 [Bacillus sp. BRMEA1]|uniref:hypothetical protein n=1 Tax=Neobacillus endophyticus TaxID=2738405 RepID=UPI00156612A6|nr:hypothetical protein [Neobacillus endophyticus]NRD77128.1 hypothetical protein [Neobacillus endophyticus]